MVDFLNLRVSTITQGSDFYKNLVVSGGKQFDIPGLNNCSLTIFKICKHFFLQKIYFINYALRSRSDKSYGLCNSSFLNKKIRLTYHGFLQLFTKNVSIKKGGIQNPYLLAPIH